MAVADSAALRGATLYFDCQSGIAGDMTVGALIDLGVPEAVVRAGLATLPVAGYQIVVERVMRGGLAGTKFRVLIDEAPPRLPRVRVPGRLPAGQGAEAHGHVRYAAIRAMLVEAALGDGARARALDIFDRVARVEARLHGMSSDDVGFHEVGAVDSIVDIVGAALALDWIQPARVISRRVPLGRGRVKTAHGILPVPAPASLELLVGADVEEGGVDGELTTPTGAAILAATVEKYGGIPPLTVIGVGWGAGDRELPDRPNLLRIVAGRPPAQAEATEERVLVIEANIDDMSPEIAAPLVEALLGAGALDAWLSPVVMKKGRPGLLVGALATEATRAAVEETLLRQSTTIGLRRHVADRSVLERQIVEVETPLGRVPVKVASRAGEVYNAAPELEACRRIAAERGVPLKRVYAEALAAFYRR